MTITGNVGRSKTTFADIQVPVLSVAAWYDIFQGGSLRNYMGLKQHAGNEAARRGQRLLVIIGGHAGGGRNNRRCRLRRGCRRLQRDRPSRCAGMTTS